MFHGVFSNYGLVPIIYKDPYLKNRKTLHEKTLVATRVDWKIWGIVCLFVDDYFLNYKEKDLLRVMVFSRLV